MKIERDDISPEAYQAIASAVLEMLKPMISGSGKSAGEDTVFDKRGLAAYLHVSESTINKLVMNKQIPHFKIQAGQSGGVRFRQRDIDKWMQRHTVPEVTPCTGKISHARPADYLSNDRRNNPF
ncbi:MAG: helix-turn-helix domain-containing protein [Nitrospiraceae bacterium]|nr:helix-turn-helix domain-containing protein [Nitrospiraceae bacterium]